MESLKKSLKPYGSHKSARSKISTGDGSQDSVFEELPILLAQQSCSIAIDNKNRKNKMMKDDNNDGNISGSDHDAPSQLIRRFLDKQKIMTSSVSSEMGVDMDLKMEGLPLQDSSISISISNSSTSNDPPPTSYKTPTGTPQYSQNRPPLPRHDKGTSNSNSALLRRTRTRTKNRSKSRLLDPEFSHPQHQYSNLLPKSSGQLFYSFLGTKRSDDDDDDDEDDPFSEEYLPDQYKNHTHFNLWLLLEWSSLICIIAALTANLCIPSWRDKNLWDLRLWKWELMILVLICGHLVSDWVIRIVVFCIERNFVLRKKVLYFVYGIRKAVQNCLWSGLVLIAWHSLFDKKTVSETKTDFLNHVTKALLCFLLAAIVWLLKTLLVKVLASSFHMSTYFDRIQESLFNQFIIETLSGTPTVKDDKLVSEVQKLQNAGVAIPPGLRASAFPKIKSEVLKSETSTNKVATDQDNGITIDHLHKLNPKNVSAWNMKRLINMVRNGALSTLDEQIPDDSTQGDDESIKHIKSENEAKAAAKKIFHNVASPGSRYIYLEDLMHFMQEDEAIKTMNLFEGASETSQISKSALKNWVVNAFREKRALALTLNDTKTAVMNLHRILNVVVAFAVVIIWLLIFKIASGQVIMFVMSQTLLSAFVFGSTCRAVFESVIFLFIMHPFDVGDRCEIDSAQLVVEEMNILTTIFLRDDNAKVMIPNNVLAMKAIYNFYRSPDMGDAIDFFIHVSTPVESIALLKQRIESYVNNKKEHWHPSPMIVIKDHESLNMIRVAIWLCHTMNFQDIGERFERRSLLIQETIKIFKDLDIQYRLLPLDINIRSMPTTAARLPPSWATITN
ncbi:unnamed protein product [Lupinus luteus]|uniref:Mechanosensitive ion channel protein n=1 Tax=Lupinus luteus TaxID=3873 RepID=A0AAV1XCG8_LUPLU